MNPRMLDHYQRELQFIREMGMEFAKSHPKIASALDLGRTECADPYVERLLEGFAFLTARIQLKMEAEFPRFTQHLLEMVYPHFLAPVPSMTVVQFQPDMAGGVPEKGFLLPRQTRLISSTAIKGRAKCDFRTAHELYLWPLQISEASYLPLAAASRYRDASAKGVKAAIRLKLETVLDLPINQLPVEKLPIYLHGIGALPSQLYELLFGNVVGVVAQPAGTSPAWRQQLDNAILPLGFDDNDALLPYRSPSFQGYRLLQEYFTLPQRFLFFDLTNLKAAFSRCEGTALEVVILLNTAKPELEDLITKDNFLLYCSPAINLFPKRSDRIHLTRRSTEHQVVIDKTSQSDYELHTVTEVLGYSAGTSVEQVFLPFYSMEETAADNGHVAYYTLRREPSVAPVSFGGNKLKAPYTGSEAYLSLVDSNSAPYSDDLKQLGVTALCTNRDLPMLMLYGEGNTDFCLEISAPVLAVRGLAGPSDPKSPLVEGEYAWRLISHLSLNYLSLVNNDDDAGAKALRDLLGLYVDRTDSALGRQIEGLLSIASRSSVMRVPVKGPMCFGRGVEITLTLDESAFSGAGGFLLGAVLERFFSKYVSINCFTRLILMTRERGEIMKWPVRFGNRAVL